MSDSKPMNSVLAAGIAAIVSGGLVYAGLTLANPGRGADFDTAVHSYLMAHPEVLIEMDRALATQQEAQRQAQSQQAVDAVGEDALLDPNVAYVEGPADAKATVVEFFDYHCPYCKGSIGATKAVLHDRNDVRFAFIEYPILSDESVEAARAAIAARRQPDKYLPFHIALMEADGALPTERIFSIAESVGIDVDKLKADMEDPSVEATIQAAHTLADNIHVSGTPTFVVNGQIRAGLVDEATLDDLIDENAG